MKQQHKLQPKLRFPEFEGDWDKSNLGNISKKPKYGLNSSATEYDGINGYLRITDIDESSNKFIKDKLTSPDSFSDEFLLKERDLIFTRTGASTGKSYLYTKEDGKLYFAGFLIKFSLKDICNDKFVFYQTKLVRYSKWVKIMSMRSGQPGINSEEYSTLDIILPSLPEQQKIADYLSTIDTKINLLEEKKAQLVLYKKAMMQKLFSQEIRFKDEKGNDFPKWEEKCLGEVFSGLKGQGLSKDSLLIEGENNCILYGELFTKYKEIIKSVISKTNTLSGVKSKCGDILIPASTTTNAFDLANATALLLDNVILGGDINILRPKQKLSSEFYAYYLSNYKKHELGKLGQGITIVHLYYTHFKNIMIDLPSLPEQQKIANFLSAIDASIEKVTEQMSQTQSFKKAMLQQMFV